MLAQLLSFQSLLINYQSNDRLTAAGCSLSLLIKYLVVKYGARNCRCLCLILVHLDTNATDFYFICGGFENQNILQEGK